MFIEPLISAGCTLSRAGGKGANLSALCRAGFPVPDAFVITTEAYRRFVGAAGLSEWTVRSVEDAGSVDPAALESVSKAIRARFAAASVPTDITGAVGLAYERLGRPAVAVRSSATAEDLPGLSFAGQHETFLNIVSEPALLDAIARCWSSLWTARAIAYRSHNGVAHRGVALAVIVQRLVPSESSGVLFTANPITGKRSETIVEAAPGLGEALVSGRVEPDRYTVAMPGERIVNRTPGSKRLSLRPVREGGIAQRDEDDGMVQALPDEQIVELARFGQRAATLLRGPQDVEWAFADARLWLLQSRPITSLYPLPDDVPPKPTQVFFSIGAVQGMLEPFTPLGQDLLRVGLASAIGRRFGVRIEPGPAGPVAVAGERLFMNITPLVRHNVFRRVMAEGLALLDPAALDVLRRLFRDPRLVPTALRIPYAEVWRVARVAVRVPFNASLNLLRPETRRGRLLARADDAVAAFDAQCRDVHTLADAVTLLDRALELVPSVLIPYLASGVGAGIGMLRLLQVLAKHVPGGERLALEATRGLPHNVTTEMDLALWRAAREGSEHALAQFLARYGMRGVGEIDIGRPRWREDTAAVRQVIRSYLQLSSDHAPDMVFARGAAAAEASLDRLACELRTRPGGWWRAPVARFAGRRMRALAGLREAPKFFIIRMMGIARQALLATGGQDVFFLRLDELRAYASDPARDFSTAIAARRDAYDREKRRRRIPRLLLSDGEAFYGDQAMSLQGEAGVLTGSGVSPGVAEGLVRVVFDPHATQLAPGEILVCPGTDPAWTPLFLTAGGLVMEVGGLLTHGSVVAREYGIPAVAGVHDATTRLRDGQRVRVDGSAGRVTVLTSSSSDDKPH